MKLTTIPNVLRQLQLTEGSISVASLRPFLHEFLRTEHFCISSILCNILEFYSTKDSFETDTNFLRSGLTTYGYQNDNFCFEKG